MGWAAIVAVASLAAAAVTAGCGAANVTGGGSTNAAAGAATQLAVAQCMRRHGVPDFPDPTQDPGGGVGFTISTSPGSRTLTVDGTTFSGPTFTSAAKTCRFGGPPTGAAAVVPASQKARLVAFARCMRAHGLDWPDPTFPAGGGVAGGPGPAVSRSPAVQRTAETCNRKVGL